MRRKPELLCIVAIRGQGLLRGGISHRSQRVLDWRTIQWQATAATLCNVSSRVASPTSDMVISCARFIPGQTWAKGVTCRYNEDFARIICASKSTSLDRCFRITTCRTSWLSVPLAHQFLEAIQNHHQEYVQRPMQFRDR